jgi:hypothetical protein
MTKDEEAIESFRKECEAMGIACRVEYRHFENGDNARVTAEILPPMKVAEWEQLLAAKDRLCAATGLVIVREK